MNIDRAALSEVLGGLSIWGVMCTRNDAGHPLGEALEWNLNFLDGIFVYDDQSTDDTVSIVEPFPNVFVEVRPDGVPAMTHHEGGFRSAAWNAFEQTCQPMVGDWVLALEPGEVFASPGDEQVALLDIIRFARHERLTTAKLSVDGADESEPEIRLVRCDPNFKFANRRSGGGLVPAPRGPVLDATDWSGGVQRFERV